MCRSVGLGVKHINITKILIYFFEKIHIDIFCLSILSSNNGTYTLSVYIIHLYILYIYINSGKIIFILRIIKKNYLKNIFLLYIHKNIYISQNV